MSLFLIDCHFSVRITTSVYPVPAICRFDQLGDWFESLADILHWNLRKSQSNFEVNPSNDANGSSTTKEPEDSFTEIPELK